MIFTQGTDSELIHSTSCNSENFEEVKTDRTNEARLRVLELLKDNDSKPTRKKFIKEREEFGLTDTEAGIIFSDALKEFKSRMKEDFGKLNHKPKPVRPKIEPEEKEEITVDDEELRKRLTLRTPKQQILDYLNTQVKQDPELVESVYDAISSSYSDEPINLGVLAPTSDGKSYAVNQIAKRFPKGDIITIGRASPTALIHEKGDLIDKNGKSVREVLEDLDFEIAMSSDKQKTEELKSKRLTMLDGAKNCIDFTHKTVLFMDNPHPQTFEMIKTIMSHDEKEILFKTTKTDGSLKVLDTLVRGWPSVIFCSAKNEWKNEVWPEVQNRIMIKSPNSNISKYKAANQHTAKKRGIPHWASELYNNEKEELFAKYHIQEMKKFMINACENGNPVLNLFHDIIADIFPSNQGEMMRHLNRLLSLVNIETLHNAQQRPRLEIQINDKIEIAYFTTVDDLENAARVMGDISSISPEKISFYNKVFLKLYNETEVDQHTIDDTPWLTSDVITAKYVEVFKKPLDSKKINENYLKPLVDAGILESRPKENNKRSFINQETPF